jgi:exopolysaccharide production protein ExoZ
MHVNKFSSLQLARALAAFIVVLYHLGSVANDLPPMEVKFPAFLSFGYAGVDTFFVLSGFIIALVTDRPGTKPGEFIFKRIRRILPFYWAFTVLQIIADHLVGKANYAAPMIFSSFLVLPQAPTPIVGAGWTLEHEFIFYGVVAVLLSLRKLAALPALLCGLFALGVVIHVVLPSTLGLSLWDFHIASLFNIHFAAGVLLYGARDKLGRLPWKITLPLSLLAFIAAGALTSASYAGGHVPTQPTGLPGLVRVLSFVTASVLFLASLVAMERQRTALFEKPAFRALEAVGDASYALYLSHPLLFGVVGVAIGLVAVPPQATPAILALSVVAAVLASLIWYRFIEAPFLGLFSPRRAVASPVAAPDEALANPAPLK